MQYGSYRIQTVWRSSTKWGKDYWSKTSSGYTGRYQYTILHFSPVFPKKFTNKCPLPIISRPLQLLWRSTGLNSFCLLSQRLKLLINNKRCLNMHRKHLLLYITPMCVVISKNGIHYRSGFEIRSIYSLGYVGFYNGLQAYWKDANQRCPPPTYTGVRKIFLDISFSVDTRKVITKKKENIG